MRKKIALFANGWTTENLYAFMSSFKDALPPNYADIFTFISYESYGQSEAERQSQRMIFALPDLSLFDAAIVFFPGLNFSESINLIYDRINKAGIPAISICNTMDGYINIGVDNYSGMLDLCNHMIEEHNCKNIVFMAGSKENGDSNTRLSALKDALSAHSLPEPIVYYSDWEAGQTEYFLQENHCTDETLPDAVLCANDHLATFAVLAFEEKGYNVPDDLLITGFDYILHGQIFHPSVASVNQHFDKIGTLACESLVKYFDDSILPDNIIVPCSFQPAESCGCADKCFSDQARKLYSHNFPYRDQMDFHFKGRMFALEESMLSATDYTSLKRGLYELFAGHDGVEGKAFSIMTDPMLANIGKDTSFPEFCFCEEMDVIISKFNSKDLGIRKIKTAELIPDLNQFEGNRIHLFSPIFHFNFMCGYIVLTDSYDLLNEYKLYDFDNKINRTLSSYKRNIQLSELNNKLSELMEQDTLTRVKNRAAYEKYLKRLERDFIEGENPPFAVIYFDINNLKMVNDMYGHEKGDAYIKNSCRLICNTFKHSPVFRIGGDEFVSIAINDDYTNRFTLLNDMQNHMSILKSKGSSVPLTERISIAAGMAEYDRTLDSDFTSIFKRADEIMYENKYKMKKEM